MKKTALLLIGAIGLFSSSYLLAADKTVKTYEGKGEVVAVSPVYSRITIKHELIKNFSEAAETEFVVSSKSMIEKIRKGDLVTFRIADNHGDVTIDQLTRVGVAPEVEGGSPVGYAVRDVLTGTSQVVNGVTQPVQPANKLANSVMGATNDSTTTVLKDAPEVKNKF